MDILNPTDLVVLLGCASGTGCNSCGGFLHPSHQLALPQRGGVADSVAAHEPQAGHAHH